jgi:hypothetical protein
MIANDIQETFDAARVMYRQMLEAGAKHPTTFARQNQLAQAFAEQTLLECSKDRVAQLTREQPEQAAAFLSVLRCVCGELESAGVAPGVEPSEPTRIHMLAAEAVMNAARAYRKRKTFFLSPKD